MKSPLQITFRHMPVSEALASSIREKMQGLEKFCADLLSGHVVVETPHHRHQQGRRFHVGLELRVPGETIVVGHGHEDRPTHEDVHSAMHDTFHAARRRLEDYQRRRRGE